MMEAEEQKDVIRRFLEYAMAYRDSDGVQPKVNLGFPNDNGHVFWMKPRSWFAEALIDAFVTDTLKNKTSK